MGDSGEGHHHTPKDISGMSIEEFDALFSAAIDDMEERMSLDAVLANPEAVLDPRLVYSRLILNDANDWFRQARTRHMEYKGIFIKTEEYKGKVYERVRLMPGEEVQEALDEPLTDRVLLFRIHNTNGSDTDAVIIKYTRKEDDELIERWYFVNEFGLTPWGDTEDDESNDDFSYDDELRNLRYLAWAVDRFTLTKQSRPRPKEVPPEPI